MSKFKEFILNNDKMIVNALILILPTLLVLLALLPMLIENYTFNSFTWRKRQLFRFFPSF